ncbi:hypothetical protein [Nonomuraea helvata]|uniref:Uncharacterized protein n=1 Tax=Nonomuraea helvata TaxID=37484 RepID=A0ABV5S0A7_9ACTN
MRARAGVDSPAGSLARALAEGLERHGIKSQISECEGIALVGIWAVGLAVWCEWGPYGWRFRWCLHQTSKQGTWNYTSCPCSAMETAVRRVAGFCQERYERMYGTVPRVADEASS